MKSISINYFHSRYQYLFSIAIIVNVLIILLLPYVLAGQTVELFASGFIFPEGPSFDKQGNLYVMDVRSDTLKRVAPDGKVSTFLITSGFNSGSFMGQDGILYLAGYKTRTIRKAFPNGTYSIYLDSFNGKPLHGPNDLAIDSKGRLYFTDPVAPEDKKPGEISRVLYVTTEGELKLLVNIPGYTNGIAFGKDPSILYVAVSLNRQIWEVVLNPDGSAKSKSILITLPEPDGPDGMAIDINGNLYVALYNNGCVRVINPHGEIINTIPIPGKAVTNCAFGGPNNDILYVTEIETGSVYKIPVGVKGLYAP